MDSKIYKDRRDRVRQRLIALGLDAILISAASNRYYLSGFELHDTQFNESSGYLIISADAKDWLITDSRYTLAAERLWPKEQVFIYSRQLAKQLAKLLRSCGMRIGYEGTFLSHSFVKALTSAAKDLALVNISGLVEKERIIKDSAELEALRASFKLNHAIFEHLELVAGKSELDLAWEIEKYFREHGASELAFSSIVAIGKNATLPHAIPSELCLTNNCSVLIDIGCRVNSYCSDQTRTFWLGHEPTDEFSKTLELVQKAQKNAIDHLQVGMTFESAYNLANEIFKEAKVEQYFTHSLGHGIGLDIHEAPRIATNQKGLIQEGMVFTVEPGLYYESWGGVRWEHTVVITKNGAEIL